MLKFKDARFGYVPLLGKHTFYLKAELFTEKDNSFIFNQRKTKKKKSKKMIWNGFIYILNSNFIF
jgi:hypothetical protein